MATENATTADDLRRVMARFPTFVTVLSADTDNGPTGCTVNAVLSLSLTPPSVLVSLREGARTLDHVLAAGRFAVNVLPWQQRELSGRFACEDPLHRFDGVPHRRLAGVPILTEASANLVCTVRKTIMVFDHTLVIGEVERTTTRDETPALVLYDHKPHCVAAD